MNEEDYKSMLRCIDKFYKQVGDVYEKVVEKKIEEAREQMGRVRKIYEGLLEVSCPIVDTLGTVINLAEQEIDGKRDYTKYWQEEL